MYIWIGCPQLHCVKVWMTHQHARLMHGHVSKHVKMQRKPTGGANKHDKHSIARVAERKRTTPCIGQAELEETSPYQRKPLRASLARASVFQLAVMLVVARLPSFSLAASLCLLSCWQKQGYAQSNRHHSDASQVVTSKQDLIGVKCNHTTTNPLKVSYVAKLRTRKANTSIKHRAQKQASIDMQNG